VLALDDLHWADPGSASLVDRLLELTDRTALMVLAAFRPDPQSAAWPVRMRALGELSHRAVEIRLAPLSVEASRQLAEALLPFGAIDEGTREGMIARAEGNPLFLEELFRNLEASDGEDRSRSWSVSIRHILPSSLQSLFAARIDRLPSGARELIRTTAVIGREFPVSILRRVVPGESTDSDLGLLVRSDLVREIRRFPALVFGFRHGMIREAALDGITPDHLRQLHARVAAAYEWEFAGSLDQHVDTIAYHHYRSDDQARAMPYLEQAADAALARGDPTHAAELLRRAEKIAARVGDEDAQRRVAARLLAVS
jgi:predicted ATPase